jgi:hypothetical protein
MSHPDKLFYPIAVFFCALSLVARVAQADDSASRKKTLEPRTFGAEVRNGEIVGWQQVRRVFVTCGTNEFIFVAPYGLRTDSNPDRVTLVSSDYRYFLAFRILSTAVADSDPGNPDFHRELLLNQFPGATVIEESSKTVAGRNGPAFGLRVKIAGGVERAVCVALIPSAAGVLEFSVNADLSKSSEAMNAFNSLLRTFRSNESGKLELAARVLDNS